VPIVGGGRVTGKAGRYSVGAINIQADADATSGAKATNFAVLRAKRDVFRRSYVGALYTRRQETGPSGAPVGETFGIDTLLASSPSLWTNFAYARTWTAATPLQSGFLTDDSSYVANFDYQTDRYWFQIHELGAGANFNPQVGFVRRSDFYRSYLYGRFSPRPARTHMTAVRRFLYSGSFEYLTNTAGRRDFVEWLGSAGIEFQSGDRFTATGTRDYEYIPRPFAIDTRSGTTVPVGGYNYQTGQISYGLGPQRLLAGTVSYQFGTLYDGTRQTVSMSSGRMQLSKNIALEPTFSANWIDIPWGTFATTVVANRTTLIISPRMFVSSLVQFSSAAHLLSTNSRFRWEFTPGSELFVVYSDGRDTDVTTRNSIGELTNRAFVVKVNKLFRY
jgi:hypothetical protein